MSRPSRWGNPFTMEHGRAAAVQSFAAMLADRRAGRPAPREYPSDEEIRAELGGRDLACWCPLDEPCHADVLLDVANPNPRTKPAALRSATRTKTCG